MMLNGEDSVPHENGLEPIAIVGYSSLLPGDGSNSESFWKMLLEGRSAMTESPRDRINMEGWYHPETGRRGRVSTFNTPKWLS